MPPGNPGRFTAEVWCFSGSNLHPCVSHFVPARFFIIPRGRQVRPRPALVRLSRHPRELAHERHRVPDRGSGASCPPPARPSAYTMLDNPGLLSGREALRHPSPVRGLPLRALAHLRFLRAGAIDDSRCTSLHRGRHRLTPVAPTQNPAAPLAISPLARRSNRSVACPAYR